jgi:hypothetical protein
MDIEKAIRGELSKQAEYEKKKKTTKNVIINDERKFSKKNYQNHARE